MEQSEHGNWSLSADSEWISRGPFGRTKPGDESEITRDDFEPANVSLTAARNGYVSFRLCVAGAGKYVLDIEMDDPIEVDLYRCWYHRMAATDGGKANTSPRYYADALVPVAAGRESQLPEADNSIEGQSHQEYWLDMFVPADAQPGVREGRAVLQADDQRVELAISLTVIEATIPNENAITCDHNSYGCRWILEMYPKAFDSCDSDEARTDLLISIMHDYYRLCHEHRGLFSNLGAEHAGTFDPIYGPRTIGSGRNKNLEDWELFDKHYGPLLSGSVFASPGAGMACPRRPAEPVWVVYTPINATWPADYLWWGQQRLDIPDKVAEVFQSGRIVQVPPNGSSPLATVLGPIRDSLGDVIGVVEFTSATDGRRAAWN